MPTVHRIRLRGGWAVTTPTDGGRRFVRSFGSPRQLDPAETVWLTIADLPGLATVTVNGKSFPAHRGMSDPFSFDITDALKPGDNEVVVKVWDPTDSGAQPRGSAPASHGQATPAAVVVTAAPAR